MADEKRRVRKRQGNPQRPQKSREKITQTAKQVQALNLRISGASFDQIATALGYRGRSGAYKAVHEALLRTIQEPADEVRKQELARLDRMLLSIWARVTTPGPGQLEAMDRALKIQAQRTFYITGLKVPQEVHTDLTVEERIVRLPSKAPSIEEWEAEHASSVGAAAQATSDD